MPTSLLRRVAAPIALAATLTTVGAARAEAQADCANDFLSAYLVAGFSCKIGRVTFSNFSYTSTVLAALNALPEEHPADEIPVEPVRGFGFGFSFPDFDIDDPPTPGNHVLVDTDAADIDGHIRTVLSFDFTSSFREIRHVGFGAYSLLERNASRFAFPGNAIVGADVRGPGGVCIDDFTRDRIGNGESFPDREEDCVPHILSGTATFTFETHLFRSGGVGDVVGFAEAHLHYAAFAAVSPAVVPEPGTVALVGGGLLALAGVARRRRG